MSIQVWTQKKTPIFWSLAVYLWLRSRWVVSNNVRDLTHAFISPNSYFSWHLESSISLPLECIGLGRSDGGCESGASKANQYVAFIMMMLANAYKLDIWLWTATEHLNRCNWCSLYFHHIRVREWEFIICHNVIAEVNRVFSNTWYKHRSPQPSEIGFHRYMR